MKTWTPIAALLACLAVLLAAPAAFSGCCDPTVVALAPTTQTATVTVSKKSDGAWLGVTIQDLDESLRESLNVGDVDGVLVNGVNDESPARKAGIKEGDVITSADGAKTATTSELVSTIRSKKPGTEVTLNLVRDGKSMTLKAVLAERPQDFISQETLSALEKLKELPEGIDVYLKAIAPQIELGMSGGSGRGRLGIYVQDLSEGLAEYFSVPGGDGVLVQDVVADSPAEKAGIKAGDVIVKIDDRRVGSSSELIEAIGKMEADKETPIVVIRKGQEVALKATVGEDESRKKLDELKKKLITLGEGGETSIIVKEMSDENQNLQQELEGLRAELKELRKELESLKSR
jgi:serine protease Do